MKLIITLCDPVLRTLNHIRRSWLVSKNWPLKTKLNHFETFEFTSNFPSNLLAIILHEMDADDDPHPSSIEGEPCDPCSGNIQKLQNYLHETKGNISKLLKTEVEFFFLNDYRQIDSPN